jgi:outer membrane protein
LKISQILLFVAVLLSGVCPEVNAASKKRVKIAIVVDGEWNRSKELKRLVSNELRSFLAPEMKVQIVEKAISDGKWEYQKIFQNLKNLQKSQVDLIILAGFASGNMALELKKIRVPIIAPFIIDLALQKKSQKIHANLNPIQSIPPWSEYFQDIKKLTKGKKVSILTRGLKFFQKSKKLIVSEAKKYNLNVNFVGMDSKGSESFQKKIEKSDLVVVTPQMFKDDSQLKNYMSMMNAMKKKTYSLTGAYEVERGALAGPATENFYPKLAKRISINAKKVLSGTKAGDLAREIHRETGLVINMKTAQQISYSPSYQILRESKVVKVPRKKLSDRLTLKAAVKRSVEVNLDGIIAKFQETKANALKVGAFSKLLPRVDANLSYRQIDNKNAGGILGRPQRATAVGLELTQVLFSHRVWMNLQIAGRAEKIQGLNRKKVKEEIVLETVKTYLNVLKAKSLVDIRKSNLNLATETYNLLKTKKRLGMGAKNEIYRFRSQVAQSRSLLYDAKAYLEVARSNLHLALRMNNGEEVTLSTFKDVESDIFGSRSQIAQYFDGPRNLEIFKKFLTEKSKTNLVDLKILSENEKIKKNIYRLKTRSLYLPELALKANWNRTLRTSGLGTTPFTLPFIGELPQREREAWSVGVQLTFPLFTGGERPSAQKASYMDYEVAKRTKMKTTEKVVSSIDSQLSIVRASFSKTIENQKSLEASKRNLEFVQDSFKVGKAKMLNLIDAQNFFIQANESFLSSKYALLEEYISLQKLTGLMEVSMDDKKIKQSIQSLQDYFYKAKGKKL